MKNSSFTITVILSDGELERKHQFQVNVKAIPPVINPILEVNEIIELNSRIPKNAAFITAEINLIN